jgi:phage shock protein PspC (stress-responsive transcriptional regulator)
MSDQDRTTEVHQPPEPGPKRLLRTRNDRVVAGVAGGLGRYFGIDPLIVRIAFAISILIGGVGVLAYVALALFVPTAPTADGEIQPAPIERSRTLAIGAGIGILVIALSLGIFDGPFWGWHGFFVGPSLLLIALVGGAIVIARRGGIPKGSRPRGALATVAIAIGAFIGLCVIAVIAAWAGATGHGVAIALTIIAIGVLLAAAALSGGARWLIAPALALAIPLGAVSAADISFGSGVGEREYRPLAANAIPADGYELGIGRLAVDLRGLDWQPNTVVDLDLDLGVGEAVVAVPSNVCVTTDFLTRAGNNVIAGNQADGFDIDSNVNAGATAMPRLDLHGEVDFGELRVINDDSYDIGRNFHDNRPDRDQMRVHLAAACSPSGETQSTTSSDEPSDPRAPEAPATPDKPEKPSGGQHG